MERTPVQKAASEALKQMDLDAIRKRDQQRLSHTQNEPVRKGNEA
jgi:energy-coupling factor transporter ATP-binding protein EcfA2